MALYHWIQHVFAYIDKRSLILLSFVRIMYILPNFRELDMSNALILRNISKDCSHLEKITWDNNNDQDSLTWFIHIDGSDMSSAQNLKNIYMDDFVFFGNHDKSSDLNNDEYSNIFLFYKCSSKAVVFERVSIHNIVVEIVPKRLNRREY